MSRVAVVTHIVGADVGAWVQSVGLDPFDLPLLPQEPPFPFDLPLLPPPPFDLPDFPHDVALLPAVKTPAALALLVHTDGEVGPGRR